MQLLFFSSRDDQNTKRLKAAVYEVIPESQVELFRRIDDFEERLRMPVEPDSIAVLSASNRKELRQMQLLSRLLTEIYVVLVLPDLRKNTIRIAHLLLPRFLSQKDSNFADLKKVLSKIYTNSLCPIAEKFSRGS